MTSSFFKRRDLQITHYRLLWTLKYRVLQSLQRGTRCEHLLWFDCTHTSAKKTERTAIDHERKNSSGIRMFLY